MSFIETPSSKICYYSELIEMSNMEYELPDKVVTQSDMAALMYLSGTTGMSKGVITTHKNLIETSLMVTANQDRYGDPRNVFLCFVPMFHIFMLLVAMYSQLRRGNIVVSMGKFDLEKVLWAVEKYRVAHLCVVLPMMVELVKQSVVMKKYDLSSLKQVKSGAAPLGRDVMEECAKKMPHVEICQVEISNFSFILFIIIIFLKIIGSTTKVKC